MNVQLPEPLAPRLPRLTADDAVAARLLSDRRLEVQLNQWLPGLTLWRSANRAAALPQGRRFGFAFTGPAGEIVVFVLDTFSPALTSIVSAEGWPVALRLNCVALLLQAAAAPLSVWLQRQDFALSRLVDDTDDLPAGAEYVQGLWQSHRFCATLRCDDGAWPTAALAADGQPTAALPTWVAALPVCVAAAFGRRRIAVRVLDTLAEGDVLALPMHAKGDGEIGSALLVAGLRSATRRGLPCDVQRTTVTIRGDHWMNEQHGMEGFVGDATAPVTADSPLADIEVDLHLELQVVRTPIAQLANMLVGYVLELPVPAADASVDLVVNGQLFGRAHLVCIGDRLGARIVELCHDAD